MGLDLRSDPGRRQVQVHESEEDGGLSGTRRLERLFADESRVRL